MKRKGIAVSFYYLERWFYIHKLKLVSQLLHRIMQLTLGCTIPPSVDMGRDVRIPHFHGIVIHHNTIIGEKTVIYQNVTIGGLKGKSGITIGNNCVIGAGACILGNLSIGNNVKIGANAVVLMDLPDNCTAVGVPAKIVKT